MNSEQMLDADEMRIEQIIVNLLRMSQLYRAGLTHPG